MKKTGKTVAIIISAIVVFVGVYFLYSALSDKYAPESLVTEATQSSEAENAAESKLSAPDFTVTDAQGNRIKLSDMQGKPVVLNFWASWCYYCKVEMPDFEEMYKKYGDSVQFMMVDLTDGHRETVEVGKAFIADSGFTFPIYFDTASEAASAYSVSGIPASYFIDAQGNLVSHASGMLDAESLENGIKTIIK